MKAASITVHTTDGKEWFFTNVSYSTAAEVLAIINTVFSRTDYFMLKTVIHFSVELSK